MHPAYLAVAVVLCWLHTQHLRRTLEQRLDIQARQTVQQAQQHAADLKQLLDAQQAAQSVERDRWLEERTLLLNRIKPETAQPVLHGEIFAPPAVEVDDDQAHWESKEAMAERIAQTERQLAEMSA